jgi:hypothetical protein
VSGLPVREKNREIASGLAGAIFGSIFASLFWAWMTPDYALHRSELGRAPIYYGGLECYRSIEPEDQNITIS